MPLNFLGKDVNLLDPKDPIGVAINAQIDFLKKKYQKVPVFINWHPSKVKKDTLSKQNPNRDITPSPTNFLCDETITLRVVKGSSTEEMIGQVRWYQRLNYKTNKDGSSRKEFWPFRIGFGGLTAVNDWEQLWFLAYACSQCGNSIGKPSNVNPTFIIENKLESAKDLLWREKAQTKAAYLLKGDSDTLTQDMLIKLGKSFNIDNAETKENEVLRVELYAKLESLAKTNSDIWGNFNQQANGGEILELRSIVQDAIAAGMVLKDEHGAWYFEGNSKGDFGDKICNHTPTRAYRENLIDCIYQMPMVYKDLKSRMYLKNKAAEIQNATDDEMFKDVPSGDLAEYITFITDCINAKVIVYSASKYLKVNDDGTMGEKLIGMSSKNLDRKENILAGWLFKNADIYLELKRSLDEKLLK